MSGSRDKIEVVSFSSIDFGYTDAQKPYIEFTALDTSANRAYYLSQDSSYSNLGTTSIEAGIIKIRVEGKAKVVYVIDDVKRESIYKLFSEHQKVKLDEFNTAVLDMIKKKVFSKPSIGKDRDKYNVEDVIDEKRNLYYARKMNKIVNQYIYKGLRHGSRTESRRGEVEAAGAAFFRFMMGIDHIPKTFCSYTLDTKEITGVLSRIIDGLLLAKDYFNTLNTKMDAEERALIFQLLIRAGIVPMLAATYVFAEPDLHERNWGFNRDSEIVRFDFGRAFWPVSSKYSGVFPNHTYFFDEQFKYLQCKPAEAFNFSVEEILGFADMTTSKPYNWITGKRYTKTNFDFTGIEKDPEFIKQKWKYFLKAILINKDFIKTVFTTYISSEHASNKFITFMINRINQFESILMTIKEFRQFLIANKQVMDELIAEVEKYNAGIKEKYAVLKVDINTVKEKLKSVLSTAESLEAQEIDVKPTSQILTDEGSSLDRGHLSIGLSAVQT